MKAHSQVSRKTIHRERKAVDGVLLYEHTRTRITNDPHISGHKTRLIADNRTQLSI